MDYIEGRSQIPLPTYFIGDYGIGAPKVLLATSRDSANLGFKMDGLRICDNLYWLKGSGKFTLHGMNYGFFFIIYLFNAFSVWFHVSREKVKRGIGTCKL